MASRLKMVLVGTPADVVGEAREPTILVTNAPCPQRVLVRNNSNGQPVYLATDTSALQPRPSGDTYELPPGAADVFVVNTGEALFAFCDGIGTAKISYAVSDAFPFDTRA